MLLWITPFLPAAPEVPQWLRADVEGDKVVLRWTPNGEPWFYSYDVVRLSSGYDSVLVSPKPLRASMWIDLPPPGTYRYQLCAISASSVRSGIASETIVVGPLPR